MTLIASLLFAIALAASVGAIMMTVGQAMPRIAEIVEMEFTPVLRGERRIYFGEVKGRRSAEIVAFPRVANCEKEFKLAA